MKAADGDRRTNLESDLYRRHIRGDVAYRAREFSTPAGSVSVSSLVYLVVATEQSYLKEVTDIVRQETKASDVICTSVGEIVASDVIRKGIYEREASERSRSLYVINDVGSVQDNTTQYLTSMNFLHTATDGLGAAQDATFMLLWWDVHSQFSSASLVSTSTWQDHLKQVWSNEDPTVNVDALIGRITRIIIQPGETLSNPHSLHSNEMPAFICPSIPNTFMALGDLMENSNCTPVYVALTTIIFMLLLINRNRTYKKIERIVHEKRHDGSHTNTKKNHIKGTTRNKICTNKDVYGDPIVSIPTTNQPKYREVKVGSDENGKKESVTSVATTRSRSMLLRRQQLQNRRQQQQRQFGEGL